MACSSILVIGAGELGEAILRSLALHPSRSHTKISVLMRPASINSADDTKGKAIAGLETLDIEVFAGDVVNDTPDQLAAAFSAFHAVISASGMAFPPGTQKKLAEAAIASNCRRYFPWQYGLDYDLIGRDSAQDLFTEQLDVRDILRQQSSLQWVIVSTGLFTSFLFEPAFGIVNAERTSVTALGSWENAITTTTPTDIGRIVAELALVHTDVQGIVFTAGDTVDFARLANLIEHEVGGKVERNLKTVDQLKEELSQDPENGMKKYRVVFAEGVGVSWDKVKSFNALNEIDTQTVEQWVREHVE